MVFKYETFWLAGLQGAPSRVRQIKATYSLRDTPC